MRVVFYGGFHRVVIDLVRSDCSNRGPSLDSEGRLDSLERCRHVAVFGFQHHPFYRLCEDARSQGTDSLPGRRSYTKE